MVHIVHGKHAANFKLHDITSPIIEYAKTISGSSMQISRSKKPNPNAITGDPEHSAFNWTVGHALSVCKGVMGVHFETCLFSEILLLTR